jgi:superfamily II DNA or RNA helicase
MDTLVVGAQYDRLIADGHIVDCDVYASSKALDGTRLAQDPVDAYRRHAKGKRAFCFATDVEHARAICRRFKQHNIPAAVLTGDCPKWERKRLLMGFRLGQIRVLVNVYVLTEGVDVPTAEVAIIARNIGHHSTYLQMVGRVLRPAPGKDRATVLDLTGVVHRYGLPTENRSYSLTGTAIRVEAVDALRVCLQCGYTHHTAPVCPRCGYTYPVQRPKRPVVYDRELRKVYRGSSTPDDAKAGEYERLMGVAKAKGFSLEWVVKEYRKLFGQLPPMGSSEQRQMYDAWRRQAAAKGWSSKYANARYRQMWGRWPEWSWRGH